MGVSYVPSFLQLLKKLTRCVDNLFVATTYKKIVNYVAVTALASASLRLNSEVVRIEQVESDSDTHGGVIVEISQGATEMFDEVIVTAPLGWLKQNKGAFVPRLPTRLSQAIDSIGYASLEKVFISFPIAFWNSPSASNPEGLSANFAIETLFLEPRYAASTNPGEWIQEMLSLASLPATYAHPTIMFYVYGACGAHVTRLVQGLTQGSKRYYEALETFFRPYYSHLPNFDASSSDCVPNGFLMSEWQNDKFAGNGSFPDYQIGLEDGAHDIEVMRQGMGLERGIWFAGDHTAPVAGLGTVAGAYSSGERVAGDIGRLYGMSVRTGLDMGDDSVKHVLRGNPQE
jgi:hypothetical protein